MPQPIGKCLPSILPKTTVLTLLTFILLTLSTEPILITTQALLEKAKENLSAKVQTPTPLSEPPKTNTEVQNVIQGPNLALKEVIATKPGDSVRRNAYMFQSMYSNYVATNGNTFNGNVSSLTNYTLIPVNDFDTYKYQMWNEQLRQKQAAEKLKQSTVTNDIKTETLATNDKGASGGSTNATQNFNDKPTAISTTNDIPVSFPITTPAPTTSTTLPNASNLNNLNNDQLQNLLASLQNNKPGNIGSTPVTPFLPLVPSIPVSTPTANTTSGSLSAQEQMLLQLTKGQSPSGGGMPSLNSPIGDAAGGLSNPMGGLNSPMGGLNNSMGNMNNHMRSLNNSMGNMNNPMGGSGFPGMGAPSQPNTPSFGSPGSSSFPGANPSSFGGGMSPGNAAPSFGGSGGGSPPPSSGGDPFARFGPPPRQ